VFNQQFESQRLSDLASWLPTLGFAANHPRPRLPSEILWFVLAEIGAPALVPDMSYEGMEVADGQAAGLVWESMVRGELDGEERERTRKALLDYCGQDTPGMVWLVERLQHVSEKWSHLWQDFKLLRAHRSVRKSHC
jgi:hypothetical protein